MTARKTSTARTDVERVRRGGDTVVRKRRRDVLVTEEPLEIRVGSWSCTSDLMAEPVPIAVTMRTPGADFDLAAGFLYAEGIVDRPEQVASIRYCVDERSGEQQYNVVTADLAGGFETDLDAHRRSFYANSSCGLCGKASIDNVFAMPTAPSDRSPASSTDGEGSQLSAETLLALPGILRTSQHVFSRTGGLHAAALFSACGELIRIREDVGRHNAMDKLVGAAFLAGELPLTLGVVLVSGRLGFEIVQKATRAGIRVLAGVSAPSSLAVELAEAVGMTLIGFLRDDRFNIYAGAQRVSLLRDSPAVLEDVT